MHLSLPIGAWQIAGVIRRLSAEPYPPGVVLVVDVVSVEVVLGALLVVEVLDVVEDGVVLGVVAVDVLVGGAVGVVDGVLVLEDGVVVVDGGGVADVDVLVELGGLASSPLP